MTGRRTESGEAVARQRWSNVVPTRHGSVEWSESGLSFSTCVQSWQVDFSCLRALYCYRALESKNQIYYVLLFMFQYAVCRRITGRTQTLNGDRTNPGNRSRMRNTVEKTKNRWRLKNAVCYVIVDNLATKQSRRVNN